MKISEIQVGQVIAWYGHGGGVCKYHIGEVISIVPAKNWMDVELPDDIPISRIKFTTNWTEAPRPIVRVPRKNGNGFDYHAPWPGALKGFLTPERAKEIYFDKYPQYKDKDNSARICGIFFYKKDETP